MQPITYLFVPADRPDRFAKALASGADMVVLDLEDAVAPSHKEAAREQLRELLGNGNGNCNVQVRACVRINGVDTPWFRQDCELLRLPGVAAVMLPKAETAQAIAAVTGSARAGLPVVPLVETARGLAAARVLAACPEVRRLAFGSVDFQQDLGIEGDDLALLFARSELVLASRLAGIDAPIDGVSLGIRDVDSVAADALRARRLGFGGKLCIHPAQLAPVARAFAPDAKALAWARGVLEAVAASAAQGDAGDAGDAGNSGALTYEGGLVDKPVIERARSIVRRAGAQAAPVAGNP
jgi:citrate lyase subunit beta/citryl-CoA lyase